MNPVNHFLRKEYQRLNKFHRKIAKFKILGLDNHPCNQLIENEILHTLKWILRFTSNPPNQSHWYQSILTDRRHTKYHYHKPSYDHFPHS